MADTIFGKIIRGELPCHKLFENDHVLAFLDINPVSPGHTLVIPKEAVEKLEDLSENAAAELGRVLPRLCPPYQELLQRLFHRRCGRRHPR